MEVKEFGLKDMVILPPAPGKCPVCAVKHDPGQPHNLHSLYYQMKFRQQHDRAPKWADAMAHCDEETQRAWIRGLAEHGIQVYGPDGSPV